MSKRAKSSATSPQKKQSTAYARRSWIVIVVGLLAILLVLPRTSTLAAPPNQTVPQPTPGSTPEPLPTATATDDEEDDALSAPDSNLDAEDMTAVVNVERLNMRTGPSVQYDEIGVANIGDTVTVIGRNEADDWWFICCATDNGEQGWVAVQFLAPNFSEEQGADLPLIPVDGPPPTSEPTPAPPAESDSESVADTVSADETAATPTSIIELTLDRSPYFALQGEEIDLHYFIINTSEEDILNVELRNELPALLTYMNATVGDNGEPVDLVLDDGATVVGARWPSLAAGEQLTATVTVLISVDAPNGAVIQNIAVANADNITSVSNGTNLGMPPAILPDFR